jgi:hypothetical protein
MDIVEFDESYHSAWQEFSSDHGTLYHDIRWKYIIEDTYKLKPCYHLVFNDSELIGILPFFYTNKEALISNPYLPYCGPLIIPGLNINMEEILKLFVDKLKVKTFIVRSKEDKPNDKSQLNNNCYVTMVKELENSHDEAFANFHYKQKNMIRASYKEAFTLKPSNINEFYPIYLRATNALGTPGHKKLFFQNIAKYFNDSARIHTLIWNNKQIGVIFEIDHKTTRYDLWAFSLKKYLKLKPNIFLYWETIKDAIDKELKYYDFGRSIFNEGTYSFKKKWEAVPYKLNYNNFSFYNNETTCKSISPLKSGLMTALWKKTPDLLANKLGPILRERLF